jgi:hypothetical protein
VRVIGIAIPGYKKRDYRDSVASLQFRFWKAAL